MTNKILFVVLFAMLLLTALTISVSADQDGKSCWCNNDQYGCWITGEKGGRNYIMFWNESARDYIMGKGSKAPIVEKYHLPKLPLECGIDRSSVVMPVAVDANSDSCDSSEAACKRCCESKNEYTNYNNGQCKCYDRGPLNGG